MAKLTYDKLSDKAVQEALVKLDAWTIVEGALTKEYKLESYKDGLVFAMAVGYAADHLNHHPDLLIGYCKVTISMITHDSGGLTEFDFELARRIDAIS